MAEQSPGAQQGCSIGYVNENGDLVSFDHWVISEETLTEEEITDGYPDGYPDGVTPTLVICID
jgi:hypothetical protein